MHTLKKHQSSGFTLIEMAISTLLIGLAIASLAPIYKVYIRQQQIKTTSNNIDDTINTIGEFRSIYGRYPCPASLTDTPTDTKYGHERCDDMSGVTPGESQNGVFMQTGQRSFAFNDPYTTADDNNWENPGNENTPRVRIGFLPFRQLGIDENDAYDGYGQRLMYAVTEHLTNSQNFQPYGGGIEILNDEGKSILSTANDDFTSTETANAHFLVFSYGEAGEGAYSREGIRNPCNLDSGTSLQAANCDFSDGQAIFQTAEINTRSDSTKQFDDELAYFTSSDIPLWQLSEITGEQGDIHHKAEGDFGLLNSEEEDIEQEAQIDGTVRAQDDTDTTLDEGRVASNKICDNAGNCFSASLFSGKLQVGNLGDPSYTPATGGMECPEGQFLSGIRNGAPECVNEVVIQCDEGSFLSSIDNNGNPVCTEPAEQCESMTVTLCGENHTVPKKKDGTTYKVSAGYTYYRYYKCYGTTWKTYSSGGSCECVPYESSYTRNCNLANPAYSGTYSYGSSRECPSGKYTSWRTFNEDCTCSDYTQISNYNCPGDQQGSGIRKSRTYSCSTKSWSGYTTISEDCACVEKQSTEKASCPYGYTGEITNLYKYVCDGPDDTSWTKVFVREVSNTCTCTNKTETREIECPDDQTGSITQQRTFNCNTQSYSSWTEVSRVCRSCHWNAEGSGNTRRYSIGEKEGSKCSCGTGNQACYQYAGDGRYRNYQSCQCK